MGSQASPEETRLNDKSWDLRRCERQLLIISFDEKKNKKLQHL